MVNNSLKNKGVTKEAAEYCFRSIINLLDGNTKKFVEYANKAIEINNAEEEKINWLNCNFMLDRKKIQAKINMKTQEIRDLEGNVLRSGI